MGLINDRVGTEKSVTTMAKELPELLTKVNIVDGFFHMVGGVTPYMYLITEDGEAIVMPVEEKYKIGLVSSAGLKNDLKEFAEEFDTQAEDNNKRKEKYLNLAKGDK